ncbi:MAG: class I SAM-dependent methyltransferase [Verrucomicrobia bacterium]|nr:class I SAM-dependent methyltransferase [Verrucomicrobiota bacterium]
MSQKYNFTLDMEHENSVSTILNSILPDTDVLEVACAHGRMTKYLQEQKHCRMTIIEWDHEAGNSAAQFAYDARHIGERLGDLEKPFWHETLTSEKKFFNHIIMADVLEHLHNPLKVLSQMKDLLKPNGSIWISVPNLAYNGVLIELLNGRFDYREIGLLDNTHWRFFAAKSLEKMVNEAGLKVTQRRDPKVRVRRSELKNSYFEIPWFVALYLRFRPAGETYQFVWELRR